MKKFLKKYWLIIAIWFAINIGFSLAANKINNDYVQRSVNHAYVKGFEDAINSINVEEVCSEEPIDYPKNMLLEGRLETI